MVEENGKSRDEERGRKAPRQEWGGSLVKERDCLRGGSEHEKVWPSAYLRRKALCP